MTRIILHIGTKKTGSTALQDYFYVNRQVLKQMGICYYEPLKRYFDFPGTYNGDFLLVGDLSNRANNIDFLKEDKKFKETGQKYETIVLSFELLWNQSEQFWKKVRDFLIDCFGEDVVIDLIIYLRRQDEYVISDWKETVKSNPTVLNRYTPMRHWKGIDARFEWDYNNALKMFESLFGIEHVIPRVYEKEQFIDGNIFSDFIISTHLDISSELQPLENTQVNVSFTSQVTYSLQFVKFLIHLFKKYDKDIHCKLIKGVKQYVKIHPDTDNSSPLSVKQRKMILHKCEEGNREIAHRYFHREELFNTEIKSDYYEPAKLKTILTSIGILSEYRKIKKIVRINILTKVHIFIF